MRRRAPTRLGAEAKTSSFEPLRLEQEKGMKQHDNRRVISIFNLLYLFVYFCLCVCLFVFVCMYACLFVCLFVCVCFFV